MVVHRKNSADSNPGTLTYLVCRGVDLELVALRIVR